MINDKVSQQLSYNSNISTVKYIIPYFYEISTNNQLFSRGYNITLSFQKRTCARIPGNCQRLTYGSNERHFISATVIQSER